MSLPTLNFRTVTVCTDARCTATGTCWRAAHERYGDAPGENYGPRCVPVPPLAGGVEAAYALGVKEGERRATAAVVAYLRTRPGYGPVADAIEEGEHLEKKP